MKLQRSTWILLAVACFMGSAIYLYEGVGSKQREAAETAAKRLFPIESEAQVTGLSVKTSQYTLNLQRTPNPTSNLVQPSPTGTSGKPSATATPSQATPSVSPTSTPSAGWTATVVAPPSQVANSRLANEATVTFLVNLLVTSDRQPISPENNAKNVLVVPADQKASFGLAQPSATVEVQLKDGKRHRLILGQPNFNRSALYAQVDPETTASPDLRLVLVPINFQNAVQRPLTEWFPASSTPSPTPTR